MTDVTEDDLRELGPVTLDDPDFPRRGGALPAPDVRYVRTRYRLFKRSRGDGAWICQCGLDSCARRRWTWEHLSGAYDLWAVPVCDARRVVRVLRAVGVHFAAAPDPTPPATSEVVSNYSDLSDAQRRALLKGAPNSPRMLPKPTADALVRRELLVESYTRPGSGWYLLTEAGQRARGALERGEVPHPPGAAEPRAPRVWEKDDPEPAEDGLEVVDCEGDAWRRRGGRWFLVEWSSGRPVQRSENGATDWTKVRKYGPLTERPHRDPKRARPAEDARPDFREALADLHGAVSMFFTGHLSLPELRRARHAAGRALDLEPGRPR